MAFNLFSTSKTIEFSNQKNFSYSPILSNLFNESYSILSFNIAMYYYNRVSIIATAIDMICDEFKVVEPVLWDNKKQDYITEHPVLDLLNDPNPDFTKNEFLSQIVKYYHITGNSYIILKGNTDRPPLEMVCVSPETITPYGNTNDIYVDYYTYNSNSENLTFYRSYDGKSKFRYLTKDKNYELWHIKDFNTSQCELIGRSKLDSVYYEISQFLESNIHNLSLLKKGLRTSALISSESEFTQDQQDMLRAQLDSDYAGAVNAGRPLIIGGGKINFNELSKTLKDMDFKDLKIELKKDIALRLDIPLALIDTSGQSYNNLKEAKLSLYDNAVIKLLKKMYEEITNLLIPRYKDLNLKNNKFFYNTISIPALREREIENIERLQKSNIMTTNELRQIINLEPINNGDIIYQPISQVPLGYMPEIQPTEMSKTSKIKEILSSVKYTNGDNVFMVN